MGRLAGLKYREVARKLRVFRYEFVRQGAGSHEIWGHLDTGLVITIPYRRADMAEGTVRAILRQAGIDVDEFLDA